ncbi:MAG: TIGR03435 family protein [Acidobacteriota bacterium]
MRKLVTVLLSTLPLCAQGLPGSWQGTLKMPQAPQGELRVVFQISTAEADALKAQLVSIDQGSQAFPASSVTLRDHAVKIVIPGVGGGFDGKMSLDGKIISGTWTQGQATYPLTLELATSQTAWAMPAAVEKPKPMAANADPSFEVVTVKPTSRREVLDKGFGMRGRRFTVTNESVTDLITLAFGLHVQQMAGAPLWAQSEKFDIEGEADGEGEPNLDQWKLMLRKMLADRFQLSFHIEKKELTVYALTVAKGGLKMTRSANQDGLAGLGLRGLGSVVGRSANMGNFRNFMQGYVMDRPVLDQTGLDGRYDFTLDWTPDEFQFSTQGVKAPPAPDNAVHPSLYTAIQQQMGLKLERVKGPADVMVVDRLEKPSEN